MQRLCGRSRESRKGFYFVHRFRVVRCAVTLVEPSNQPRKRNGVTWFVLCGIPMSTLWIQMRWSPLKGLQQCLLREQFKYIQLCIVLTMVQICAYCKQAGCCISCKDKQCATTFHPSCGLRLKLFMWIRAAKGKRSSVIFESYCSEHSKVPWTLDCIYTLGGSRSFEVQKICGNRKSCLFVRTSSGLHFGYSYSAGMTVVNTCNIA